ncbi:hypothetical protein [Planctomyces sp. SH-PL14]|uniref:phosphorylase family protein n=1 Tax=Planctomyces sp. SH-PL14 TaxID=1632864 RepID=UPI00078D8A20|nr:hypothetical protein [Planctomyces sp. SH-PL14]AMV22293.1 Aminodeoxyfutalosine nucleosidase [Planctomyces sp. SH-PL14]
MTTEHDESADHDAAQGLSAAHADIGLVAALHMELAPFLERCLPLRRYTGGEFVFRGAMYDDTRIAAVESGPGTKRATRATQSLLDAHEPQWVLSVGFSGGLTPEVRRGHIVVANSISDGQDSLEIDVGMSADPAKGLHVGRFLQVNEVVRTIAEKQALAARTGAIAVDMESFAVAKVCVERKVRFLAIRCISDDLSEDLPPEILTIFGKSGFLRAGAVLGSLWKRWSSYKDLLRLRDQAQDAARRLGAFLPPIIERLADDLRD